jgi:Ca2+-binding RTX toxin-like protein
MSMRRFHFERIIDVSGTSGCGVVAEGVIFSDGKVALEWFGKHSSTNLYNNLSDVEYIHGHEGKTKIVFDDPEDKCVQKKEECKNNGN